MDEHRTLIIHMTDLHDGKKTSSFDQDILQQRMDIVTDKLMRMRDRIPFTIDKVVVIITGDTVDGSLIYPTQGNHQDEHDTMEQADNTSAMFITFAMDQVEIWGCPVELQCVAGNHGRVGKFHHENTNWDVLVYRTLFSAAEHYDKVSVYYSREKGENRFLRTFKVYDTKILLYHGQGIRMYQNIPRYGIVQRIMRWATTRELGDWTYLFMGHFHRCEYFSQNERMCYMGGTMATNDDWALEILGCESDPHWWVLLMREDGTIEEQFKLGLVDD